MSDSDWFIIGSVAAAITAVFTATMAVAIILTAIYAKRTLQATRSDSRARTRPALFAYLERELLSHGTILLVVKNFGRSSASHVQVAFDPPAPSSAKIAALPDSDVMKWLYQRFEDIVPTWAPGWSTSNVIRTGEGALERFTVILSYLGPDETRYDEHSVLHPGHILKETMSTPSKADSPIKLGQEGVSALQALVRTIRSR